MDNLLPFQVVLTAVFAAACAAPSNIALGHAGIAAAPVAAVAAAPAVAVAAAPAVSVPAPYSTSHVAGAPTTAYSKAPTQIRKELHYGSKDFISGYSSSILKPAIPDFKIAVPTALKGTVRTNAPIVKTAVETHVVNEPVPVERKVPVPYDVPIYKEQLVEVPRPVHVERPYAVPVPTPVRGEDIVQYRQTAPVVQRTHSHVHTQAAPVAVAAAPAVAAVGYAAAAPAAAVGYAAAAPAAVGYAAAAPAAVGYAAAAPVAALGHAGIAAAPAVAAAVH